MKEAIKRFGYDVLINFVTVALLELVSRYVIELGKEDEKEENRTLQLREEQQMLRYPSRISLIDIKKVTDEEPVSSQKPDEEPVSSQKPISLAEEELILTLSLFIKRFQEIVNHGDKALIPCKEVLCSLGHDLQLIIPKIKSIGKQESLKKMLEQLDIFVSLGGDRAFEFASELYNQIVKEGEIVM